MTQVLDGLEAFALGIFTKVHGWSAEEVQLFLIDVRKDMMKKSVHLMFKFYVVYGQRLE
ncbi:MAG: hypothetical protein M1834_006428 [Cirrosporium novae-zelandiae]|nr:MAG: hypothetical protein M1834_006428 [Cirrosporium novae-zelandiae]